MRVTIAGPKDLVSGNRNQLQIVAMESPITITGACDAIARHLLSLPQPVRVHALPHPSGENTIVMHFSSESPWLDWYVQALTGLQDYIKNDPETSKMSLRSIEVLSARSYLNVTS